MQRLTPIVEFGLPLMEPSDRGLYVLHGVAHATIARLTAERDEARASAAAAYERAARVCANNEERAFKQGRGDFWAHRIDKDEIRALATEAETNALAEIVKRAKADGMREAEAIIREMWASTSAEHSAAILARIDQRKEAGE